MEELTFQEKLLIAWALGMLRHKMDAENGQNADSIIRKLKT